MEQRVDAPTLEREADDEVAPKRSWGTTFAQIALATCALAGPMVVVAGTHTIPVLGPNLTLITTAVAVGIGLLAAAHYLGPARVAPGSTWLLLYAFVTSLSAYFNHQTSRGYFLLPFLVVAVAGEGLDGNRLLTTIRGVCFLICGLSLYWAVADLPGAFFVENDRTLLGFQQVAGVTPHPNALGPVAALGIGVELARHGRPTLVSVVRLAASIAACVLAQSHDGWVIAGIVALAWFLRRRESTSDGEASPPRRGRQALVIVAVLWLVAARTTGHLAIENWRELLNGRQEVWSLALKPFYAHRLLGGGPGVFGVDFRSTNGELGTLVGEAHNQAIESLAEAGLVGACALAIGLLLLIGPARRAWRRGNWLPGGLLLASVVYFTVEAPLRPGLLIPTFWVLCLFCLTYAEPSEPPSQPPLPEGDVGLRLEKSPS